MILSSYKSYIIYSNISHCILDDFGVAQPLWLQLFQVAIFRSRIKTRRRCTARFWTPTTRHLFGKIQDPLGGHEIPWMTWLCHRRMASNCWLVNWNIYAIDAIGIFWACGAGCWLLMFLAAWPRRQSSSPMVYEISFQGKRWLKLPSRHDAAMWSYFFRYSGWVSRFHNPPPRTALRSIWGCCEVVYSAAFHSEIHEIRQQDAQHRPGDSLHHHQDKDTSLVTFRANVDTEKSKSSINPGLQLGTTSINGIKWPCLIAGRLVVGDTWKHMTQTDSKIFFFRLPGSCACCFLKLLPEFLQVPADPGSLALCRHGAFCHLGHLGLQCGGCTHLGQAWQVAKSCKMMCWGPLVDEDLWKIGCV